jgi:cell shape-determining protein MreD
MPMAVLWAAYGWAFEADDMERVDPMRGVRAPATLAVLGLLQDQLAGGPLGFYLLVNLFAYLIGHIMARLINAPNVLSLWAGFAATCAALSGVVALLAPWALRGEAMIWPFALGCAVTAALFPLVRPLYLDVRTV